MITDTERREVARRLRALDYSNLRESLICAYLDALGIEGYEDWVGIAHRLADLIEPEPERTCHNLNPPSCRDFECSECGESSEFTPGFMPNYCPQCGARVEEASDDADR